MKEVKKALLIVGSPRRRRSTSASLGNYLMDCLEERGLQTERERTNTLLDKPASRDKILSAVEKADIVVLAAPLYVDSLPMPAIRLMEEIAVNRGKLASPSGGLFLPLLNCGYPEAFHNDTALDICRQFALECGFQWAGGLSLGGGELIRGRPLSEVGLLARNVKKSLALTAASLAEGKEIPEEAARFMEKPMLPMWLYTAFIHSLMKRTARKHKLGQRIYDRPYQ